MKIHHNTFKKAKANGVDLVMEEGVCVARSARGPQGGVGTEVLARARCDPRKGETFKGLKEQP